MKLALLGRKLGHSLSPVIHEVLLSQLSLEGTYELIEAEPEELSSLMTHFRAHYDGINVTIPYKKVVIPLLDSLSPEAEEIGAVNTISFKNGKALGYNTDCNGFGRALAQAGIVVRGKSCTIIGAGGGAQAVRQCLEQSGAAALTVASRHPEEMDPSFAESVKRGKMRSISLEQLERESGKEWLLVNCTPVGMFPHEDDMPVSGAVIARFETAADLIYNPAQTKFLRTAKQFGAVAMNGLYMLAAQAAEAEEIWTGHTISEEILEKAFRAAEKQL